MDEELAIALTVLSNPDNLYGISINDLKHIYCSTYYSAGDYMVQISVNKYEVKIGVPELRKEIANSIVNKLKTVNDSGLSVTMLMDEFILFCTALKFVQQYLSVGQEIDGLRLDLFRVEELKKEWESIINADNIILKGCKLRCFEEVFAQLEESGFIVREGIEYAVAMEVTAFAPVVGNGLLTGTIEVFPFGAIDFQSKKTFEYKTDGKQIFTTLILKEQDKYFVMLQKTSLEGLKAELGRIFSKDYEVIVGSNVQKSPLFCNECGCKLNNNSKFCPKCGRKLS